MCERRGGTHGDEVKLDRASDPGREGRRSMGWAWGGVHGRGCPMHLALASQVGRCLSLMGGRLQPAGAAAASISLFAVSPERRPKRGKHDFTSADTPVNAILLLAACGWRSRAFLLAPACRYLPDSATEYLGTSLLAKSCRPLPLVAGAARGHVLCATARRLPGPTSSTNSSCVVALTKYRYL